MLHRLFGRADARANSFRRLMDIVTLGRSASADPARASASVDDIQAGGRIDPRRLRWGLSLLLLLSAGFLLPGSAEAHGPPTGPSTECTPSTRSFTVAANGTATLDLTDCSIFGTDGILVQPTHGTLDIDPDNGGGDQPFHYTNNGDGALSDTFIVLDDTNGEVTYNVTVLPAASPITVTPGSLPTPVIGTSYSQTLSATGGVAPYTYSATGLPTGLTISSSGVISGTPTGFGPFNVSVTVHDSTSPTPLSTIKSYSVIVAHPVLVVTTPPAATVSVPYSQQLMISGGTAPYYNFALSSGSLPAGLSLSSSGVISGTPTATTSTPFQISVYDSSTGVAPYFGILTVTVTVNPAPTITLSPTTLGTITVGSAFSQTFTPTGGTGPYTYSVSAGALPAGLTLNGSTGLLSGTPTAGGPYSLTIGVHDAGAGTGSRAYSGTVQAPTIVIAPTTLTAATQNAAYSTSVSASGGTSPYTYAVTAGALPAGLTLASNGAISGAPTVSGSFNFTVTATDSSGGTGPYAGSRAYTLTVNAAVPVISPTSLPAPVIGVAYSETISASNGTGAYTFVVSAGALPAGLTLSSSGVLSGTPTETGSFPFTVQVTDAASVTATQAYTFTIAAPTITVAPVTVPAATLHAAYSQTVTAAGGTAPYTFTATGALPTGLTLSSAGVISGTPSSIGTYNFTVNATDSTDAGPFSGTGPFVGSRSYSIVVSAPVIVLAPSALPNGQVGTAYSQTLTASGGAGPYTFAVTTGTLPAGVALSSGGALSGTPTQGGSQSVTITATDANGDTGGANLTLVVNAATVTIAPTSVPAGSAGNAYSRNISASGGTAPYTFSLQSGSLPAGVSLAGDGTLSGTPTAVGNFSFTVQAVDSSTGSGPYTGTRAYALTVNSPGLVITPGASTLSASYAAPFSQTFSGAGGTTPYTFVESGTLPSGVTWNAATGTLSGTPVQPGSFPITITLTDSSTGTGAPFSTSTNYTLVVSAAVITITPTSLSNAMIGVAYPSAQLTASGGQGSYTYSISAGALPAGMTLGGGAISGTPTSAGTFNFTVSAQDANGFTGSQAYTINVGAATLTLNPATLPAATAETAYGQTLAGSGGTAPYSYSITAGALPAGISLNASTGALSGTPSASGSFTFTAQVHDSSTGIGAPFTAARSYTLVVNAPAISITPAVLPSAQAGASFSQQVTAAGGDGSYTYTITTGSLPAGISLSSAGLLSGTPTAAGTFNVTVEATDGHGFTGTQNYALSVSAASLTLTPATLSAATAESAYSQSFSASGGTAPYTYSISSGALPAGLNLVAGGVLSGTPTVAGSFTFSVRVTDGSTGVGAPFTATRSYTLVVNAPGISVAPGSLSNPQAGAVYSQQLTASGGNGTYAFTVSAGALPGGLSLGSNGLLSGTPAAAGSFGFTVTATDGLGFTGAQAYTVSVGQPQPVAVNDSASTVANSPTTIAVTTNDTGPITSIAIMHAPTHGSATVSGLGVVYTPTTNYFGSDSLTYTATGPGGTSAPATVTIVVTPLSVPTAAAQTATVLAGKPVTIHGAAGATGGPFTGAAIVSAPGEGTAVVSGTDIVFTPPATASGAVTFTYSLSNVFGTSAPATVTVTVNAIPVAPSRGAKAIAGVPVLVDITTGSSGGPFTAAAVVSVSPANLGSASIVTTGDGYQLRFEPTATANGTVAVSYTLSNAYATSAAGVITIAITPRSDPSKDPEVLGLIGAQTEAMRRFATGQISNFQQRLESMHGGGGGDGQFTNGISLVPSMSRGPDGRLLTSVNNGSDTNSINRRYLMTPESETPVQHGTVMPGLPSNMAVWTGGAISFGSRDPRAGHSGNGFNFNTSGLSAGTDYRVNQAFAFGAGIGYGHDDSAIGRHGSHSTGNSYSMALYASYHPSAMTYLDGLAGYQTMSFDSRRFVTDDGSYLEGRRHAGQFFASLAAGYDYRKEQFHLSPYGRVDIASGTLNGYTEHGDSIYALNYRKETVKTTTGNLGLRVDYQYALSSGTFAPMLRLEYQHDFQGSTSAAISYADLLSGPLYRADVAGLSQNRTLLGVGASLQTGEGLELRFEFSSQFGTGSESDQSIMFNLQKKF
ncbi:putative Ig domain-containing protein [Rhodanobacter sp. Col0626]|uniref:putative Ig domain-containing protein n=1 Tax=Rhodanobacter sp. Col0626 TaxID=3415679 RepID=UPI003CEA91AC